jgi:hypothetical protein
MASRNDSYQTPTDDELAAAERLFELLLCNGSSSEEIASACKVLSFETITTKVGDQEITIAREQPGARRGWGIYAFRRSEVSSVALQAPHSESDKTTGDLVETMFIEGRCRAVAWNTVHRDTATGEPGQVADLCRLERSVMEAFSRAFATAHRDGILIQVHGFHSGSRTQADQGAPDVILSNSTRKASDVVVVAARSIEPLFEGPTLVFPRDTDDLGGTRNIHGKLFRRSGHKGFVHVELSMRARRALGESAALRRKFLDSFVVKRP